MFSDKKAVHDFWEDASCGESLYLGGIGAADYAEQARIRYELEPYIRRFATFDQQGKRVLEIGVGLGADHQKFAEQGAILTGVDLTERATVHTGQRLKLLGLSSSLLVADTEDLPFRESSFDMVYSWGVLHHTPETAQATGEVYRVLKPNGVARIMIYHKYSCVGFMLWLRYALFRLRPFTSLTAVYGRHLESPGTKAFSITEAERMFNRFRAIKIETILSHADLLSSPAGQRHRGPLLTVMRFLWPRWIIRSFFKKCGLFMLITATK